MGVRVDESNHGDTQMKSHNQLTHSDITGYRNSVLNIAHDQSITYTGNTRLHHIKVYNYPYYSLSYQSDIIIIMFVLVTL